MTVQFPVFFTLTISHTYYSQVCQDFSFIIPTDTAQLLKNGRLITKVREGKLYVFFAADEAKTALVPLPGNTLRFGLKLLNPFFSNFTDFNFNSATPIYRNATNTSVLDEAQATTLVGQLFSRPLANTERPVTITLKDSKGHVLKTDTFTDNNKRSTLSYDLTGQSAGVYSVEESYTGNTETTAYYSDAELQQQGIFGVIEIKIDSSFYTTAPEFAISFTAKQETLKYYVVAKNYEAPKLSVKDEGGDEPPVEDGRAKINFDQILPADFTDQDISPTLLSNKIAEIVLFKSQEVVSRQEKARQKIQLQNRKNGQVEVLIPHLPQPGVNKTNSDIIVQLTKPKP